ncbi:hypothetical protein HPB51_012653 [Rhipicephalus microplus]|uniref:Uncharacterized protein n=1 Tax=Rhipicephalus microplus TaxID=6941 RepID=A0A9J6E0P9_RHIMP|nr:hypothetical protein HPB51_012653 [Rhipicephalus microplus]
MQKHLSVSVIPELSKNTSDLYHHSMLHHSVRSAARAICRRACVYRMRRAAGAHLFFSPARLRAARSSGDGGGYGDGGVYYSQRTLAALGDLNLRFLSRSLRGRQCYLFPADTYTYRIKPPDTTHSLGPGVQGPRTNRAGRMAYFETCPMADSYSKLFTDYGVEALFNDSFLVYTEPQLLARFADYMHQSLSATCMGVWNPHMDDFGGVCGYGVYPLCGALFRYYNDTHE